MEQPYNEPRSGFWGRGTIAAGAVIVILLLLLGYVLWGRNGNQTAAPTPPTTATHGSRPTGGGSGGGGTATSCNLPAGDESVPEATPQGIRWSIYQTVALPSSPTAGPEKYGVDVARCYAHDPLGALIAASQLSARLVLSPSTDVAAQQVVPGPGQRAFITQDEQAIKAQGGNASPGDFTQLAGFKYVTYSPSLAVIELATQGSNGAYQATTVTVAWVQGDWKLVLQPNGATSPNALPLSSIVGYSTWAGV